jgi:hypothetical protein
MNPDDLRHISGSTAGYLKNKIQPATCNEKRLRPVLQTPVWLHPIGFGKPVGSSLNTLNSINKSSEKLPSRLVWLS